MSAEKRKQVGPAALANALLNYCVLQPRPGSIFDEGVSEGNPNQHYKDELLFLRMFAVDYVLSLRSTSDEKLGSVREHYNEEIDKFVDGSGEPNVLNGIVASRFTIYWRACNSNDSKPRYHKGEKLQFWELGKAFCSFASDIKPLRPSASALVLHVNFFMNFCSWVAECLDNYELVE
jgi:hypothetical protein